MELNIAQICEAIASAHPDRECMVFRDRTFTWAQSAERTRRLARVLHDGGLGVRAPFGSLDPWESVHDHVALYLHNGNEYMEGMLGAWKARCAPFNVNYRYVAEELRYLLDDARPAAIVVHECFTPILAEVLDDLTERPRVLLQVPDGSGHPLLSGAVPYEDALAGVSDELPAELVQGWSGDDLYLCYTGGTTGMPKGAMWRQADFVVSALGVRHRDGSEMADMADVLDAAPGTVRALPAPPMMHGAAHWNALSCWIAGGTVIIQDHPESFDPGDVLDAVENHRATSLLVVGDPMARPLLEALRRRRGSVASLRHLLSGGAVLSAQSKAELARLLDGVTIVDVLGSTESGRQAVDKTSTKRGGVGDNPDLQGSGFRPSLGAVVLSDDRRRRLNPGDPELGWLAQTGRVPLGYLGDEAATVAAFPVVEGMRHAVPGDRARLLADGSIELHGRDSVCINTGGEKVFAEEVETALKHHPAVFDAVVCGRESARWGEEVVGVVQLRPGIEVDDAEILATLDQHLAGYKVPKALIRVPAVLRSPAGKADYRWARAVVASTSG